MKKVNFKRYYDHITTDTYHDVPDEVFAEEMGKADALQRQWSKQAQKMRKAYLEGDISAMEFEEWLDNL